MSVLGSPPTSAQALPIRQTNPVGELSVAAPPETAPVSNVPGHWVDVPGLSTAAYTRSGGNLAVAVSAEVWTTSSVWLRVLVDGQAAAPSDVVFKSTGQEFDGTRSFTFGRNNLGAGKHIVQVQWYTNPGTSARIRDRALSVNSAAASAGSGRLVTTASESAWISKSDGAWANVPNLTSTITLDGTRDMKITFSGQTTSGTGRFFARAVVDGQPTADVLFEDPNVVQGARSYSFVKTGVGGGTHTVSIQWRAEGGSAVIGDWALAVFAAPASTTGGGLWARSIESGATNITSGDWVAVPGLSGSFTTNEPSTNAEIEVGAELASHNGRTFLRVVVDGQVLNPGPGDVSFSGAVPQWRAQSYTFTARNLLPGSHSVQVLMAADGGATGVIGDRVLNVVYKRRHGVDFAQAYQSLRPRQGSIPSVAICFDPRRPGHSAPTAALLRAVHDGSDGGRNVNAWYRENTGSQFGYATPTLIGCNDNGWFAPPAGRGGTWYWDTGNFPLMWQDALKAADPFFNFKAFDRNGDNHITGDELVVEIVRPQNSSYGTMRTANAPLDGVSSVNVDFLDLYISPFNDLNNRLLTVGLIAHEAAHDILGATDMHTNPFSTRAGRYSLMDDHGRATHLDPFHKLKSGFVTPDVVEVNRWSTRTVPLAAVETRREITIVYDPAKGDREYFILENRWGGAGNYDENLLATDPQGIVVWHIVEDIAIQDQFPPPGGSWPGSDWGRKGVRKVAVLSGAGQSRTLAYANGTAAGIRVTAKAGPQEFLNTEIARF